MEARKYLAEQLEYQKRLNFITNRIHSAKDTDEILIQLQDEILGLFDADRITIYVADHSKKEILSKIKTGNEVKEIRVPINNHSISGYCAVSRKIINVGNVYEKDEISRIHPQLRFDSSWDHRTGYRTTQTLAAPILNHKRLHGVIQLVNKKGGNRFTAEDQIALQDIAKVLGSAFHKNLQLVERIKSARFDFLVDQNIISQNEMTMVMSRARDQNTSVESILMNDFNVSKEHVGKSLAEFYRTPFIPFDEKMDPPKDLLKGLRPVFLKNNGFVPIGSSGKTVLVAMTNPGSLPTRDVVKRLIRAEKFKFCVALKEDIDRMIELFFDLEKPDILTSCASIEDILGRMKPVEMEEDVSAHAMGEDDSTIVQLVNKMIIDAFNQGVSDIHIEPQSGTSPTVIRMRIDGACRHYLNIPHTFKRAIVSRIKIMSDLNIAERRLPQDGKIKFKRYAPLDIELRVATIPTTGRNEDVILRILKPGRPIPLNQLGMTERDYHAFVDMIGKPYGMVLVVGPTGSGKTTTLHSAMHHINRSETKIWTAEDPVEITQKGLRQVQVHPRIGFTFASAMRSFLRADPDVIMVGEMRDHETMSTGIEASLTGHLVLSTLHTNSAPETVTRLLDMGMDPFNFADAFLGVLAQRLARTLCRFCKASYQPGPKEIDTLARMYGNGFDGLGFLQNGDGVLYRATGCSKCNQSGYLGRVPIFELLKGTDEMKSLIQLRASIGELRRQGAEKDGMTTLMQDGIRKVCLGITDLTQIRRVCIR